MTLFHTRHKPPKNSFLYHQLLLLNDTSQIIRPHHGLSHFQNHKFKHSFENTLNQLSLCGLGVKTNTHLLLHHLLFISNQRWTLLSTDNDLNLNYFILLHKPSSDTSGNIFKLNRAMNYVITTKIFEEILFCYLIIFYQIFVFSYFLYPNVFF